METENKTLSIKKSQEVSTGMIRSYIFLAFAVAVMAAPAEEPVKIDLPVFDQPNAETSYILAEPLEPENHPGETSGSNSIYDNLIGNKIDSLEKKLTGPFTRITALEKAVEEKEGYGSKILSVKENLGNAAAGIFKPTPIVDIIKEEDKYGNTGDKFYNVGRAVVNGSSKVSTYISSLFEIPGKFVQQISRIASEKLNNVGAKVVGL